jgi:hypothetical protein
MNQLIARYEVRLGEGARILSNMEAEGNRSRRYESTLRHWLELLAAYEFECEMAEAGDRRIATAVGV